MIKRNDLHQVAVLSPLSLTWKLFVIMHALVRGTLTPEAQIHNCSTHLIDFQVKTPIVKSTSPVLNVDSFSETFSLLVMNVPDVFES
jgi:hypothetical protein